MSSVIAKRFAVLRRCTIVLGWLVASSLTASLAIASEVEEAREGSLYGDDPPAQDDCKAYGPWPGRKHRH